MTHWGDRLQRAVPHLIALAVFGVLAIIYTWPVARDPSGLLLGYPGDNLGGVHTLWWVWDTVSKGAFPWAIDAYGYPSSQVVLHPSPLMELASLPFTGIWGAVVASNVLVIGGFVAAGYTCFLLVRHLTGSTPIAVVAGAFFTGTGAHQFDILWNTGAIFALPLLCLALVRWRDDSRRWVFVAVAAILLGLSNFYFAAYFLPPLFLAFAPWHELRVRRRVLPYTYAIGTTALALGIAYLPSLLASDSSTREQLSAVAASADSRPPTELMAPFIGSPDNPVLGGAFRAVASHLDPTQAPNAGSVYVGLVVLVLAAVGWRAARRTGPWLAVAIIGFVLMLGPRLRIWGHDTIPLPYDLLVQLPGLSFLRAPGRFFALVEIALVVMAAFGLMRVTKPLKQWAPVAIIAVGVLGLVDSWYRFPQPTTPAAVPGVYERLGGLDDEVAIIEAPGGGFNDYQWLANQRVSRLRLVNNAAARPSEESNRLLTGNPFLAGTIAGPSPSLLPTDEAEFKATGARNSARLEGARDLARQGIGLVVLHKSTLFGWASTEDPGYQSYRRYLTRYLGAPIYADEDVEIFGLPKGPGVSEVKKWSAGTAARTAKRGGTAGGG